MLFTNRCNGAFKTRAKLIVQIYYYIQIWLNQLDPGCGIRFENILAKKMSTNETLLWL